MIDPEAPMTETSPIMLLQVPNSLVRRPPAAAWQPGERPAASPKADEVPPEELPAAEEPVDEVLVDCPRTIWL